MKIKINILQQQNGYALFEILIVAAMSVLFLVSSYQIYYGLSHQYKLQERVVNNTDAGIYLSNLMQEKFAEQKNLQCLQQNIITVSAAGYSSLPATWRRQVKKNTDLIELGACDINKSGSVIYRPVRYFIAKTNRYDENRKMIYGLYQKKSNGHREELLPGVASLKIDVAEKEDSRVGWLALDKISSWSNNMLMRMNFTLANNLKWPLILETGK